MISTALEAMYQQAFPKSEALHDAFYRHMALPDSTFLGTRITKKMLLESAVHNENSLTSVNKILVTEFIQSIEWRNTLKPETINISAYVTEQVEYPEIVVLHVIVKGFSVLNNKAKNTCFAKLAKLLHELIPYPLIVVAEQVGNLAISLAEKRVSKANRSKLVVEHVYASEWMSSTQLPLNQQAFLLDFSLKNASNLNYFELYQDLISMMVSLDASKISGVYRANLHQSDSDYFDENKSADSSGYQQESSNVERTQMLKGLEVLESKLTAIRTKLKNESQMSEKMRLNIKAREVKAEISLLKGRLR